MYLEKIAKKYLKIYRDPEQTIDVHTYKDWNDYLDKQLTTHEKIQESEKADDIRLYVALIKNPYLIGLATAFQTNDYELLHNSIYHYSKHRLLHISDSGYDHCTYFWKVMDSMACNYKDVIESCYPEQLGLCQNGYPLFVVASNLLMALWYENEQWMELAFPAGEKFLNQKKGRWEKAIVTFLMALSTKDMAKASEELSNVCKFSTRIDRHKIYKSLCTEAHGLYHIARNILAEDDFLRIEVPTHDNFCSGLLLWQKEHDYPERGKMIITYPEELNIMNRILELSLPQCTLVGSGKKQTVDVESMQRKLLEEFENNL